MRRADEPPLQTADLLRCASCDAVRASRALENSIMAANRSRFSDARWMAYDELLASSQGYGLRVSGISSRSLGRRRWARLLRGPGYGTHARVQTLHTGRTTPGLALAFTGNTRGAG
jgi:hypothetical protein